MCRVEDISVLFPILVIGWGDTSSAVLPWLAGLAGLIARKLCEVRGGGESKRYSVSKLIAEESRKY